MVELENESTMDHITFRSDTVLSDVHLHIPNKRHLMVRLNAVGQPVFLSQFKILNGKDRSRDESHQHGKSHDTIESTELYARSDDEENGNLGYSNMQENSNNSPITTRGLEAVLDEDGDLEVSRRPQCDFVGVEDPPRHKAHPIILTKGYCDFIENEDGDSNRQDIIKIEHTMATTLEDVGKQVWRGAFLLADYILWCQDLFRGCTVLELGAGTGLTSIIMATVAKTVYCTDVGEDLLDMCDRNVTLNVHLLAPAGGEVKVRTLDWLKNELSEDPEIPFSWSEEEVADLHDHTTVILCADVFYDDDLTDALFKTLYRITHSLTNPCTIYLSIEKRLNFTLRHMDITCDAYNHFQDCLDSMKSLVDGKMRFTAETIETNFPQFFIYERIKHLISRDIVYLTV
ncbi:methyltransferase-like protein 22 isoform X3 [Ambystoma mexicanum]|uniref:methyltransferase-like protein 22 isoform X3 n=1 Tax=Ambystoma mexicanum TaxID=8296 RepID=UPI0037E881BE